MRSNKLSQATVLGAALTTLLGTAAFADSIYVGSPAVVEQQVVERQVVTPAQVVIPTETSSTVVEKRVIVPPATSTVVEEQSVVSTPAVVEQRVVAPAEPDILMKRSVTFGTTKPLVKTTTSAATLESCAAPVFHTRIQNMKDQVNLGLSKGYMSASDASAFGARLEDLKSEADSVVAEGTPKYLSDRLEKRLTGINIEISNAMTPEGRSSVQVQ
ncbi:hypothetical protein KF728_00865 [Candidatus Obscuribacterales bacterium]|nr:hypothetical protein [Candidatus Obscuribacterales bacterium]MBX3148676.1 hypothetical protein [Candidatus Obscuribacterales bacterium]